jgi:hypothetical protein
MDNETTLTVTTDEDESSDEEEYMTSDDEPEPEEGVAEDVDMRPNYSDDDSTVTTDVVETTIQSGPVVKLTEAERDLPLINVSFTIDEQRRLLYDMFLRGFDELGNLVYVSDQVLRSEAEKMKRLCREISLQENPDDAAAGELIMNLPHTLKFLEIVQARSSS